MLKGKVKRSAARVIANGSTTNPLSLSPTGGNHAISKGVNNTMPNVENAESAKEREQAEEGSTAISATIATPKEDKAYERLCAVNEIKPTAAITLARMHDTGNPTIIRYTPRNRSCTAIPTARGSLSAFSTE